jgi:hypothetical protein
MRRLATWASVTLLVGGLVFMGFEYYALEILGEGECNRADCSWVGDLAYGSSAMLVLGLCWITAGAVTWAVLRGGSGRAPFRP